MARYLVMQTAFIPVRGIADPVHLAAGQDVEFDGVPGTAPMPLDDAARAATLAEERLRTPEEIHNRNRRRLRARTGLPKPIAARAAKAQADYEAYRSRELIF